MTDHWAVWSDPATVPMPAVPTAVPVVPGAPSASSARGAPQDRVSAWNLALAVVVLLGIVVAATLILLQGG